MVFLGDIAFYLATLIFAVGIWMIHHANHHDSEEPCKLLKSGGYIVTVISILGMLCTGYYWLKYFSQDAFDSPHPRHAMMSKVMDKGGMMGMMGGNNKMGKMQNCMGQMEGKTMDSSMMAKMRSCMMMDSSSKPEGMSQEEHKSHH